MLEQKQKKKKKNIDFPILGKFGKRNRLGLTVVDEDPIKQKACKAARKAHLDTKGVKIVERDLGGEENANLVLVV